MQAVSDEKPPGRPASDSHLYERPERDRAEGPEGDIQAEIDEWRLGWGEDWDIDRRDST